jgi:hydrogenase maturation protein HypF
MNDKKYFTKTRRVAILARGRVQGVGFRPTLYRRLRGLGCGGHIRNTPEGVLLEVENTSETIDHVIKNFKSIIPPRCRIDELHVQELKPEGQTDFYIHKSTGEGRSLLPIPPDLSTCDECKKELEDNMCRRNGYAFNTCTSCGPRFTIATGVPFDRPLSSMKEFPLCPECNAEFTNPHDRRFHAQTMSCPTCGPSLKLLTPSGEGRQIITTQQPIHDARDALANGKIVAIKGVGGFHLACDAFSEKTVAELRSRKQRPDKPFAIMVANLEMCRQICRTTPAEEQLLTSPEAPVVLLEKRNKQPVADNVAPSLNRLGVMLPYTPLHTMLFQSTVTPPALVMTSCNRSEEPIAIAGPDVWQKLGDIVDVILDHNRTIVNRCDDSVFACPDEQVLPLRRSRGYVPEPVMLDRSGPSVFATGAMMKNTFAITTGNRAFISQHIGNVSDADNAQHFAASFEKFSSLLKLKPSIVACDMHPDYPTTEFAKDFARANNLQLIRIQHHHAHICSCLAEYKRNDSVIGVSMDGTGYGPDGTIWGGEFMLVNLRDYTRKYHLETVPMPGGDKAVREPLRMALAWLVKSIGKKRAIAMLDKTMKPKKLTLLLKIMDQPKFSPLTSSCGRLFDAVSALLGVCRTTSYDGQPACELEAICRRGEDGCYPFAYNGQEIGLKPLMKAMCEDIESKTDRSVVAARFHNTMIQVIVNTCERMRDEANINTVVLSGGVMQNITLLTGLTQRLNKIGFETLTHHKVPPNDGGICLGQAISALAQIAASQ